MATKGKTTHRTTGATEGSPQMGRLELVPRTLAELPIMLMGRLYYRPHGGIRRILTPKEEKLRAKAGVNNYRFLRDNVWSAEETVVNKCLEGLLMAAPPAAVGAAINAVAPSSRLASPIVCKLRYPKQFNRVVGEPDFLLWDAGRSALVIGEIKIGAKSSNGRYSDEQLKKYMRLGLLARGSLGIKHVTHLIVLPSMEITKHCTNVDYWKPAVGPDGRLLERANRFMTTMVDYQHIVQECARHLETMDLARIQQCLDPKNPLIPIDTFVTSWESLCQRLSKASVDAGAGHLTEAFIVLQRLGEGRFAAGATGGPD